MPRTILLDTNLLVLFVTGLTNPNYISKHKRLQVYGIKDFEMIRDIVAMYDELIICPNVLSETSNLLAYMKDPIRSELFSTLKVISDRFDETYVESTAAMKIVDYSRLGLTDAVILHLSSTGSGLLTDDLDLYLAAIRHGFPATNYSHVREQRYDFD